MKVSASLPTGVAALLFDGAKRHRQLEKTLVEHLEATGFDEVMVPVVDYLHPYEALLSEGSRAELYRFVDRDGELLLLRADFTPMLARLLAPQVDSLDLPLHLFYRGEVMRYQEERAGRQREFHQIGAEIIDRPGPTGEAGEAREGEALERFLELLETAERRRRVVVLGFAGALDRLLLDAVAANGSDTDAPDAVELVDAIVRRERRHARKAHAALLEVVQEGVPSDASSLGERAAARLERLVALRDRLAAKHPEIDLRIDLAEFADQVLAPELLDRIGARAYYDGLIFRAFAGRDAETVGRGGRYDRLFRSLDAEVTAVGFTFSLDRLLGRGAKGESSDEESA